MVAYYNQTVRILRPEVKATRGGDQLDYAALEKAGPTDGVAWPQVYVRPSSSSEVVGEDREVTVTQWHVAGRPGSPEPDLRSSDWIRLPSGEVCEVVGEVARPTDPTSGRVHHVEITVKEATG